MHEEVVVDKLEYVIKTLSRTRRKDWENYVVNAVWNRLNDWGVKPVSQQYIRKNGKGYLIDLYFPQVNIGIECDEAHHLRCEGVDHQREIDIIDYLDQVSEGGKADSYKAIHIRNFYADTGERIANPIDFERQINACVDMVRAVVARKRAVQEFHEWTQPVSAEQYFLGKDKIDVGDRIGFRRISDACNVLFGTRYSSMQRSYFMPSTMRERYGDEYLLWFPKLAIEGKAVAHGWNNRLSEDGLTIVQYNEREDVQGPEDPKKRVTLAQVKDPITGYREYRFFGVFEFRGLDDGKEIYTRCDRSFGIVRH